MFCTQKQVWPQKSENLKSLETRETFSQKLWTLTQTRREEERMKSKFFYFHRKKHFDIREQQEVMHTKLSK